MVVLRNFEYLCITIKLGKQTKPNFEICLHCFKLLQTHRELAREAVRKSLVLLKNGKDPKKPFLPLDKNAQKILVVGKHADDLGYQCGGWTATWEGTSGRITIGTYHMAFLDIT